MSNLRWRNSLLTVCVAMALSFMVRSARAQNVATDPCLRDARCQELLAQAQAASQEQRNEDALNIYGDAYRLSSAPWLLVNIGRMQHKLGRFQDARKSYTRYLASPRLPDDDEQRSTAIGFLHQTESQLAHSHEAPVYKKWWFWTLVGGAAAAVVVGTAVGVSARQPDLSGVMQYRLMP